MPAQLIDEETVEEANADNITAEAETNVENELPEKYRNKSPAELAKMHQEAEKLLGKHSAEVGELRKVVDEFIRNQTEANKPAPQEVDDVDFFVNPRQAIAAEINNHPDVVRARQFSQDYAKTTTLAALQRKHPDVADIVKSPEFHSWVKESPVRRELYKRVDENYDFSAGDELFTNWKKTVPTPPQPTTVESVSTGSVNSSSEARGKKLYRRTDLIKLMKTDPDRYERMQPDIMKAYTEGRVR